MYMLLIGFIFSAVIGILSYLKGALTISGVLGAVFVGTVMFGFGQYISWYLLLIIFFIGSTFLSFHHKEDKREVADVFDKTGKRDGWQVLANGGWATLLAIVGYFIHEHWVYFAFVAAIATVNADTWATEIGVLSKGKPRYILNGRVVEKGTSGGISAEGLLGSLAGSLLISVSAFLLLVIEGNSVINNVDYIIALLVITAISGLLGGLIDSLLGATIQSIHTCQVCHKETEKKFHCGKETTRIKGFSWMNNDLVNFISSVAGSLIAVGLYWLL